MWTCGKVTTCPYWNKHLEDQDRVLASVSPWRSQPDSGYLPWDQVPGLHQPTDTHLEPWYYDMCAAKATLQQTGGGQKQGKRWSVQPCGEFERMRERSQGRLLWQLGNQDAAFENTDFTVGNCPPNGTWRLYRDAVPTLLLPIFPQIA